MERQEIQTQGKAGILAPGYGTPHQRCHRGQEISKICTNNRNIQNDHR